MINTIKLKQQQIWFNSDYVSQVDENIFMSEYWRQQGKLLGQAMGRGTTWFADFGRFEVALRHYRRGGMLGKILTDQYLFTKWEKSRSCQEFMLLSYLKQQGINVPTVIAARTIRRGLWYTADIITEKIKKAQDLIAITETDRLSDEVLMKIGREIRKMHDVSVNHTDLNIKNIMLDGDGQVWLIDFDKCLVKEGEHWKKQNLDRLRRSIDKENQRGTSLMTEKDYEIIVHGYREQ
ncbi:3-deoxy-D-manno-octulosonic acid kinase [Vibrio astriarenae]